MPSHARDPAQSARQLTQEGRAALRSGDRFLALRKFAMAHELQPADPDIRRAMADVLMELGAPQGAARYLPSPGLGIAAGQAAEQVRWAAQVDNPDPAHHFDATDAAIATLQSLIAQAQALQPPDPGLVRRLQGDLVVALRDRERWKDAVTLAEEMQGTAPLPPYVRQAQADALLALLRPQEALVAYRDVLATDPRSREARAGLFYAQIESEDFASAFDTADALAAEGAPQRRIGVSPVAQPDSDWLDAQVLRVQARRYGDMPAQAWELLHPLADAAPAAAYLRAEQGQIAAARGWPRLAHEEALIAWSLAPNAPGIRMELAQAEFRRRHWDDAERRAGEALALRPDDPNAQRMLADIEAHHDAQLLVSFEPRTADGGGRNAPGDGMRGTVRIYSPPLAQRWRLLAAAERKVDRPEGENLSRNRYGAGVEGRWPDVTFELVGWANRGLLDHSGADASVQWQPDDHWTLHGALQAFTQDTPLRAVQAGVRADAAKAGATYAWDNDRVASLSLATLDFTDGNRRWQATLDYAAAVEVGPRLNVLLRPAFYTSRNSLDDAPYFNPKRDASLSLATDVRHLLWRRYERSLRQRLVVTVGGYRQSGFGSDLVGGVEYSQTYAHAPRTGWEYGIAWARNVYDSDVEQSWTAFVRLDQRF